ncbi:MAG: hypothetical protein K2I73_06780 [Eubacterium sp.]|nr:hypothetical protein [Eubacterium sp.]
MMKMKFKDFEFPSNPLFVKTEMAQRLNESSVINGECNVFSIADRATVIKADGCFWGEDGADASLKLKILMKSRKPGWLFLPDGSCYNAYLSSLDLKEDAKKNAVSYSLSFIEKCPAKSGSYAFAFTYAEENENLFDIAFRCDKKIEDIMRLNDFANPFAVQKGDKVVLQ